MLISELIRPPVKGTTHPERCRESIERKVGFAKWYRVDLNIGMGRPIGHGQSIQEKQDGTAGQGRAGRNRRLGI